MPVSMPVLVPVLVPVTRVELERAGLGLNRSGPPDGVSDHGAGGGAAEGDAAGGGFLFEPIEDCVDIAFAPIGAEAVHLCGALVAFATGTDAEAEAGEHFFQDSAGTWWKGGRGDGAAADGEAGGAIEIDFRCKAGADYGLAEVRTIAAFGAMGAGGAMG